MATILEFRSTGRQSDVAHSTTGKSADILLFTGVRYERWEETSSDAANADRRLHDGRQLDD